MINRLKFGTVGLATVVLCLGASASVGQTINVRYYPHELATPAGVEALHDRIVRQAHRVCHGNGVRPLARPSTCRDYLVRSAVEQIGNPMLTALHDGTPATQVALAGE